MCIRSYGISLLCARLSEFSIFIIYLHETVLIADRFHGFISAVYVDVNVVVVSAHLCVSVDMARASLLFCFILHEHVICLNSLLV